MSKNDEKILRLKKIIEERKKELGKKATFTPITNCSLEVDGQRYNIHALNDYSTIAYLMCKIHAIAISADALGLDAGKIMICGYPASDWLADLKLKMDSVERTRKENDLRSYERKLDALLSSDKKTELEINSIEEALG